MEAGPLLSFALASLLIELTPGPNMTYLALVAAGEGRRRGYAAVAGVALGLAVLGLAAALGVAELLQRSALAYEVLRWAGGLFLLYLAWDGWRGDGDVVQTGDGSDRAYFLRGLVTNMLNPKAALFYVAVLPTFLDPARPLLGQTLALSAVYVAVATIVHSGIVTAAGALTAFTQKPGREIATRRVLSSLLALVAFWLIWSTAR
ncbi:MAG: LysE family translocator [Rhizobiaceae bacterium]|nr:LysE family translocator [Rhizobiaceae bacterium]